MDAEWQPEWGRDAGETDNERVHVHTLVDDLLAIEGVCGGLVYYDSGHVADGRRCVREPVLELLVAVKQLGEPDHQGVVAEIVDR